MNNWESENLRFNAYKLYSPIEYKLSYPDIISLLAKTESDSSKKNLTQAYIAFSKFIADRFYRKYKNSDKYSQIEKNTITTEIVNTYSNMSKRISTFNSKVVAATQKNKAQSRKDPSVLIHKPKRCLELFKHIQNSSTLSKHLKLLTKGTEQEIEEQGWDELTMRQMLLGLLTIFSGGQRPHVAARMTIQEFKEAALVEGVHRAQVADHKTDKKYGPATLLFLLPRLYSACHRYFTLFKSQHDTSLFLLSTPSGTEMEVRNTSNFIMDNYLKDIITPEEKKHYIPKMWRKCLSNINRTFEDKDVIEAGQRFMNHSDEVDRQHYTEEDEQAHLEVQWAEKLMERINQIHSNPNVEVEDKDNEEDASDNEEDASDNEEDASENEEDHTQQSHTAQADEQEEPLKNSRASISSKDRELFRKKLKPSSKKGDLGRQIRSCCDSSRAFREAYNRVLAAKSNSQKAALNTIRKSITFKTPEQSKASNESRKLWRKRKREEEEEDSN